jgi:3-oxoacyl-[acyl-carrier protein] reductase
MRFLPSIEALGRQAWQFAATYLRVKASQRCSRRRKNVLARCTSSSITRARTNFAAEEERRNRHYAYITTPMPRQSLGHNEQPDRRRLAQMVGSQRPWVFYCTREALS